MKKFGNFNLEQSRRVITKRFSSGQKSHFLAMPQLLHRVAAICLLALVNAGAWAADYVFISNETNGYFINNSAAATQTFTVETCVWSCINTYNTASELGTNNRRLVIGSSYLNGTNSNSGTVTIGTSRNAYWRSANNILQYYNNSNRPVYRDGTAVKWTNSTTYSNAFRVYSYAKTDENFTVAPITGVADILSSTGSYNLASAANYTPEYYTFTGPDTRYYASGYTTGAVTTKISAKTSGFTSDTWTITPSVEGVSISNSGVLSYTTQVTNDVQITITHTVIENGKTKSAEKTITLLGTTVNAPVISSGPGLNQYTITGPVNSTIKYTINGDDINEQGSNGTTYTGPITITTLGTVIKAKAVREGKVSTQAEYSVTKVTLSAPVIAISDAGSVTITNPNDVGTIHYTTDGSEPTASSSTYSSSFTVNNMATVKAIVTGGTAEYITSTVASKQYKIESGISGGTVVLNDYEDHTWTYYAGVDSEVDGGNYNTNYKGKLYSPNPRNVKITYNATNNAAVSIDENETSFIYYKTLEEGTTSGQYPYQVISNPFSKRPNGKGFGGWKLKSISTDASIGYAVDATLPLDEVLTLTLPDAGVNGTSAEIVFEATWVDANVTYLASVVTNNDNYTYNPSTTGDYEKNILVINKTYSGTITASKPVTITMVDPATGTLGNYTFSGNITPNNNGVTKIENAKWNVPAGGIAAGGKSLWIGRGVVTSGGTTRPVTLAGANVVNQVVKIESGSFTTLTHYSDNPSSGFVKQELTLGCDYDRAINDNSKLSFSGICIVGNGRRFTNVGQDQYLTKIFSKSGTISNLSNFGTANYQTSYYMSGYGTNRPRGKRYVEIEGGDWKCNIAGGQDVQTGIDNTIAFHLRMKGGRVRGAIYTGAQQNAISGSRVVCITGGQIGGWISGGVNGLTTGGTTAGTSYVYVGGNADVDSKYQNDALTTSNTEINNSIGGYVYGAGCGFSATARAGEMTYGTNVVVADNATIEHGAYGGGGYGYTPATANVYVTGGHVKSLYDPTYSVFGGVYGGARQNDGGTVNMYMTGGQIDGVTNSGNHGGGLFGGSNYSGTIDNSVKMVITGGQVGTTSQTANIHGGGYGESTTVSQNVDITLGLTGAGPDADGVTVYGDVYGGSALGSVNVTTATNTFHTYVTMNAGYIHGSLYGGALGATETAANVYGPVAVKVYGGSVMNTDGTGANGSGAVYGANNINGAPQRAVTVDIYGTNSAPAEGEYALFSVYGGGNQANYTYGNGYPKVTVHNCDNSIEYVYGGGNAAAVAATDVTIYGGDKIGNVFGGGNGQVKAANVNGNTNVKIYGGTIGDVYGGSNTNGTIGGTINVNVNATAESGKSACPINIDNVYGGGNKAASNAGNITIGCAEHIGAVYGGANQANITGDIDLKIESGHIDNVFGGNNNSGTISGKIVVTIEDKENPCGMEVVNVYGAGNQAAYTNAGAYPEVNILNGKITGNVFGGGLGETAVVTSNPAVLINGGTVQGNVFGGGEAANVVGNTAINVISGTVLRDLYGGGALADVTGNTTVSLTGGTVHDVYGGGLGDASTAALINGGTNVTLNGSVVTGSIFGCNNVNGTPQGHVKVLVQKTTAQPDADEDAYHVAAVYGGGNQAAYIPTDPEDYTEVEVLTCDNSIEYVYGGGNAASTPKTQVTINGGKMFNVFGGGNGAGTGNPGADVGYKNHNTSETYGEGTTNVNIYGGTITSVFGGSNTKGNIRVQSNVNLDDAGICTFDVGDVYGAGNEAEMYGNGNLIIGCIPGLNEIYGGAKNADIHGDVSLTIRNGKFGKVFGGNNLGGNINGSITVNIEETGCRPIEIGELYGGGNLAAYTAPAGKTMYPEVNIKSFTSIGTVYGGGLGVPANELELITDEAERAAAKAKGVVKGNPHVNIGLVEGKFAHGGTYEIIEFPAISNKWHNFLGTIGDVYGGGNAADVDGDTYVNIATTDTVTLTTGDNTEPQPLKGVNISGNVYGGGNAAHVTGKTHVQVGKATYGCTLIDASMHII